MIIIHSRQAAKPFLIRSLRSKRYRVRGREMIKIKERLKMKRREKGGCDED